MDFLKSIATEANVLTAIGVVVGAAVYAYRALSGHNEALKQQRLADIRIFVDLAYRAVNEIARRTPGKLDDKIALGLQKVNEALEAAGKKPTSEAEAKLVQQHFDATHGDEKRWSSLGAPVAGIGSQASSP